jgi:hypothetical protein
LEDPELRAKAEKLNVPIDQTYGDDVLQLVKEALNQPPGCGRGVENALDAK